MHKIDNMARKRRVWYPGATYHVMSRGNRRTAIFKDHTDYLYFLELVSKVKGIYPFKIHSLCLMSNHFHMSLETMDTELWKIMQKILSVYAEEFNYRHGYTGHLFEGRYTACLVEDERYFLEVSRYIHLNPIKAAMVREPLAYDYSSYKFFVNNTVNENQRKSISTSGNWLIHHVSYPDSEIIPQSSTVCLWKGRYPMQSRRC